MIIDMIPVQFHGDDLSRSLEINKMHYTKETE